MSLCHPIEFLKHYRGYLQVDAYSGYGALFKSGRVIEVGYWSHARRRYFEIATVAGIRPE